MVRSYMRHGPTQVRCAELTIESIEFPLTPGLWRRLLADREQRLRRAPGVRRRMGRRSRVGREAGPACLDVALSRRHLTDNVPRSCTCACVLVCLCWSATNLRRRVHGRLDSAVGCPACVGCRRGGYRDSHLQWTQTRREHARMGRRRWPSRLGRERGRGCRLGPGCGGWLVPPARAQRACELYCVCATPGAACYPACGVSHHDKSRHVPQTVGSEHSALRADCGCWPWGGVVCRGGRGRRGCALDCPYWKRGRRGQGVDCGEERVG